MNNACLPLEGVKVLELATVVAAPVASRVLSDYGAEVIKIESPPFGDLSRTAGADHRLPVEDGNNPYFDQFNSGKKFVAINLKSEEGKEIFLKLLEDCDIFLTNVRSRSLERLGIDYESLKDRFPQLIYAQFTGFGTKGDEANRPSYDQTAFWSRTGTIRDSLTKESAPASMPFAFGDLASSNAFVAGILTAYIGRIKHGKGSFISTSLLKSAIWCSTVPVLGSQPQYGKEYPEPRCEISNPFSTYYRCGDGEWLGIFDRAYERNREYFAEIFNIPELASDIELSSISAMQQSGRVPSVIEALEAAFAGRTADEWLNLLGEKDVICEKVRHYKDIHQDPQALANEMFEVREYEDGVSTYMPAPPIDFIGFDRKEPVKTGLLGHDTDEVLASLGYTDEQIEALRENDIIQ